MTDAVDPFAQAASGIEHDPFSDPIRGEFPRVSALLHKLLILTPVLFEKDVVNKETGTKQDRWSVDTVVIDTDGSAESYASMYWSQKSIVNAMHSATRNGKPVLATLHMFPVLGTEKTHPTEAALLADEDIQRWLARGSGQPPMKVAWGLEAATPAQRTLAMDWWTRNKAPFA